MDKDWKFLHTSLFIHIKSSQFPSITLFIAVIYKSVNIFRLLVQYLQIKGKKKRKKWDLYWFKVINNTKSVLKLALKAMFFHREISFQYKHLTDYFNCHVLTHFHYPSKYYHTLLYTRMKFNFIELNQKKQHVSCAGI